MNMLGARQAELGHCITPWHGCGLRLSDGNVVVAQASHLEKLSCAAKFKSDPHAKLYSGFEAGGTEAERTLTELRTLLQFHE